LIFRGLNFSYNADIGQIGHLWMGTIYHMLPAAYYLSARFHNDLESAVLHAINGGGRNQVRAMLTGALTGAQVGLSGIPQRLLDGLENVGSLLQMATALTGQTMLSLSSNDNR
jgi:ADP-ribosylglycohydrolase